MKDHTLKALTAVIIGGVSAYLRIIAVPLIVLAAVMIVDYMSGMLKAWGRDELSSRVGLRGIVKKLSYLLLVCVAGAVDWLVWSGLAKVGIRLDFGFCFGLIVIVWLIINELISILENLEALEVPMPRFLVSIVKHLKTAVEVRGESEEDHELR
jgi:toxin secretion/phage lysis holin